MSDRFMEMLYALFNPMPRQGPGSFESTKRAFGMVSGLPDNADVLDVGCGSATQTLDLARLGAGRITGVDTGTEMLRTARERTAQAGYADATTFIEGDMRALDFPEASFDLIWSEGAIFIMGFEAGLRAWRPLLKPGGCVAVSEMSWLKPDPPKEAQQFWNAEYPGMADVETNLSTLRECGYEVLGHFHLPIRDWWEEFYVHLEKRLPEFAEEFAEVPECAQVTEASKKEMELFREYSDWYGYEFYIARKRD